MNRRLTPILVCTVALFFALAGCQKSSDQSASNDPNAAPSAADSPSPSGGSAKKAAAPAPAPKPVVIPADTVINVVNDEPLSSRTSTSGQRFKATVEKEIEVDGKVVIAKGAHATGMVKDAKPAGRFKGGSALELTLISVEGTDGKEYDIQTSSPTLTHKGKGKRTAVLTGGGGAAGALIGGLAGGGKGALIGAVVGAGAGGAGSAFTGKAD